MTALRRCSCGALVEAHLYYHGTDSCSRCYRDRHPRRGSRSDRHSLSGHVSLGDIDDVYRYATEYVARRMPHADEIATRDDVIAEAVAILCDLHANKWDSAQCPSFARYTSTLLWQRLIDWWRKEMRRKNGSRRNAEGEYEWLDVLPIDGPTARKLDGAELGRTRTVGVEEGAAVEGAAVVELRTGRMGTPEPGEVMVSFDRSIIREAT